MSPVECDTWYVEHCLKFQVPTSDGLKDYFVGRLPYNHMLCPISFPFHFVEFLSVSRRGNISFSLLIWSAPAVVGGSSSISSLKNALL